MKVTLVSTTKPLGEFEQFQDDLDNFMISLARVSNESNQFSKKYKRLLRHCMKNGHWSVFEMADATFKVETSIFISAQLLRHKSASFQQLSRRYSSEGVVIEPFELRKQAQKNRQSSTEPYKGFFMPKIMYGYIRLGIFIYNMLIRLGVGREVARGILPQNIRTTLYMKNNIRGWIHFLNVRKDEHSQKEIRLLAEEIYQLLRTICPITMDAADEFLFDNN